jgi:cell division protein FtsB
VSLTDQREIADAPHGVAVGRFAGEPAPSMIRGIPRAPEFCHAPRKGSKIRRERAAMYSDPEPRRSGIGGTVFTVAVIALMGYLSLAALQGEHGLFSLLRVEAQETRLRAELVELQAQREAIANKTRRLSTEHLDVDLLDEQARSVLGLGRPDEIIIR